MESYCIPKRISFPRSEASAKSIKFVRHGTKKTDLVYKRHNVNPKGRYTPYCDYNHSPADKESLKAMPLHKRIVEVDIEHGIASKPATDKDSGYDSSSPTPSPAPKKISSHESLTSWGGCYPVSIPLKVITWEKTLQKFMQTNTLIACRLPTCSFSDADLLTMARTYQQRVDACERKIHSSDKTMFNSVKPVMTRFYREPVYAYNRFVERKQYMNYIGVSSDSGHDDSWPIERYLEEVEQPICELERILDSKVSTNELTREEAAFLRVFFVRSLTGKAHLASCIDRAESFAAFLLENTPPSIIPLVGMMFFWTTRASRVQYRKIRKPHATIEGYCSHAVVCVTDAAYYRSEVVKAPLTKEVLSSSKNNLSSVKPPSVFTEKKTMLCDASIAKAETYLDEDDWQNHMLDTGDFFFEFLPFSTGCRLRERLPRHYSVVPLRQHQEPVRE